MVVTTRPTPGTRLSLADIDHVKSIMSDDIQASAQSGEHAITLPPRCYTDPTFFEFEKDAIFYREWLCLGRVEQLAKPGDYFAITVADEPLIVVRVDSETINVMSAVCRHRGNVITGPTQVDPADAHQATQDSEGHGESFKCIYHEWIYGLDGRLVTAPAMDKTPGFDPDEIRLPQFRTEVWNGFIFVNFDEAAAPLGPRISSLTSKLANFELQELVSVEPFSVDVPWNWKIMQENSIEGYHTDHLHRGFEKPYPSDNVLPPIFDDHQACIVQEIASPIEDFSFNPTFKAVLPVIKTLSDEDRRTAKFGLIPPTLLIGTLTDCAFYRVVHPLSADRIRIKYALLIPKTSLYPRARKEVRKMASHGAIIIARHDAAVNANVQKGLKSRFAARSRYSWQEGPLPMFNKWLVDRYSRGLSAILENSGLR